jgi:flagellar biosynthesis protein FlhG
MSPTDMNSATAARPVMHPAAHPRRPNIIAVGSGKGGVGKTFVATTLAHAFARRGLRTLLFDGDLGLANIDIQLGLMPERDLGAALEGGQGTLADAITRFDEGGFDIIAGKSGSASLGALPAAELVRLRSELLALAVRYDRVVIDLGAGADNAVRILSGAAGMPLVVATDEPTALTDAYAFIKLTLSDDPTAQIRVIINSAASTRDGERTYAKLLRACEGFLKVSPPLAGIVRRDPKVRDAIRHQVALLSRHPLCEAAVDVEAVAERLLAQPRVARAST